VKPWLQALWRPTLMRRVFGALLLAFALAGMALLILDFVEFKHGINTRPGVQALAEGLVATLADVPELRDANLIVQARARELNRLRREDGRLPGDVEFSLYADGSSPVFATAGSATATAATHWMAEARAGRWRLKIAEPHVGDATVLGWLGRELLGSLLLAFPFVLLPLWLAVRRGMRPLQQLAQTVAARDAGDLSPLALQPQHDELRALARAFDALLDRLRAQRDRERAFIQDAAHELRTPMAVVAAQAHLLTHTTDATERSQVAAALEAGLQRASHLSRQLLTLATLDEVRSGATESLDLTDFIQRTLAQLAPQALARNMDLSFEAPPTQPAVLDRLAFETVLLNLIDNALRYVPTGGRIAITLDASARTFALRVADDGPGIPPTEREAAFERFWRGAASADATGSGLGLAIVRQAALRLGGKAHITEGLDGLGCAFVVEWPQTV